MIALTIHKLITLIEITFQLLIHVILVIHCHEVTNSLSGMSGHSLPNLFVCSMSQPKLPINDPRIYLFIENPHPKQFVSQTAIYVNYNCIRRG
jgi:hypothetical protein